MQHLTSEPRIPFLDAARAFAACMGVILHTAAGYVKYPVPQWPHFAEPSSLFFDYIACAIHMFRVPVFFFLAGFFSYRLFLKFNYWGFAKNRTKRIALPFLFFSFLFNLSPLLTSILKHQILSFKDFVGTFHNVSYLWFLEYLLVYYILFILLTFLLQACSFNRQIVGHCLNQWMRSKWKWFPLTLLNFGFLYLGGFWFTPILLSFVPNIWLLSIYGVYFTLGLFTARQGNFGAFFTFKWRSCWLGMLIYSVYLYLIINLPHQEGVRIIAIVLYSLASYLLFTAFISVCFTFFTKKNVVISYFAQASYWIYLSQVFFIVVVYRLTARFFDSIFTQFLVICTLTLCLSLLTYHFCKGSTHKV